MSRFIRILMCIIITSAGIASATSSYAQQKNTQIGRETFLPIPRYVSIKASEANLRIGPGQEYRIEWVYSLRNMPVQIIAESGQWRKVRDFEGVDGWVYYTLLSGKRTVMVTADKVSLNRDPRETSNLVAILEKNVIANLLQCSLNWCQIEVEKIDGWVPKKAIWGVDAEEIIED